MSLKPKADPPQVAKWQGEATNPVLSGEPHYPGLVARGVDAWTVDAGYGPPAMPVVTDVL